MMKRLFYHMGVALICLWFGPQVQAQHAHSLAFNDFAPQHIEMQIASQPTFGYLALPGLGNMSVSLSNTVFHPATWLTQAANDDLATIELDEIFLAWENPNRLAIDIQTDLIQFGKFFKNKRSFVHGGIREVVHASLHLSSDLLRLPFTGNANFDLLAQNAIDFSDLGVNVEHRRSFYMGWQRNWSQKWSTGLRLNYLRGIRKGQLSISELNWHTDETTWDWTLSGQGVLQSSGMWPLIQLLDSGTLYDAAIQRIEEELVTGVGSGLAIDVGGEFRASPHLMLYTQVNDLGRINWKTDTKNFTTLPASLQFNGLDWNDAVDWTTETASDSLEDWAIGIAEELEASVGLTENATPFHSRLGASWSLGAEYTPWPNVSWKPSLGVMIRKKNGLPLSWRSSWNQQWGKRMKTALTFGSREGLCSSLGMSVALNVGPLLVTAAADSYRMFNWTEFAWDENNGQSSEAIVLPTNAPSIQIQIGVVLRMGWTSKQQEVEPKSACEPFVVPSSSSRPQF
jgi:hypothetical protein